MYIKNLWRWLWQYKNSAKLVKVQESWRDVKVWWCWMESIFAWENEISQETRKPHLKSSPFKIDFDYKRDCEMETFFQRRHQEGPSQAWKALFNIRHYLYS